MGGSIYAPGSIAARDIGAISHRQVPASVVYDAGQRSRTVGRFVFPGKKVGGPLHEPLIFHGSYPHIGAVMEGQALKASAQHLVIYAIGRPLHSILSEDIIMMTRIQAAGEPHLSV